MFQGTDERVIERRAKVVGYHPHGVVVEVAASPGCAQCAKGQGCGAGLLARRSAWQLAVDVPSSREDGSMRAALAPHLGTKALRSRELMLDLAKRRQR